MCNPFNPKKSVKDLRVPNAASFFRRQSFEWQSLDRFTLTSKLVYFSASFPRKTNRCYRKHRSDAYGLALQRKTKQHSYPVVDWKFDPPIPVHIFNIRCFPFFYHCNFRFCCRKCGHRTFDSRRIRHGRFCSFFPQHQ